MIELNNGREILDVVSNWDDEIVLHCVDGKVGAVKKIRRIAVPGTESCINNAVDQILRDGFQGNIRVTRLDAVTVKITTEEKIGRRLLTEE